MKTKFLPTMIGAILAGGMGVAQADVQVMGHIDTAIVSFDNEATDTDDVNLKCTTCSVGFKGSEDLGNGLKAIFKLDFQYDTINRNTGKATGNKASGATATDPVLSVSDTSSITDRDQWLGLKGNFGQVRVGTISTGYKSHGAMIDPLYRTVFQGRDHGLQSSLHSGAGEELEGRADNTIRYDSPSFNGLKVVAHYTLDSNEGDGEDEDPFGIGASYENGGILVFADYMDNNQSASDEFSAWKVGGKYSMNNFAVMAQYEQAEEDSTDPTQWHVGGSYTMGNNMIYAAFGQSDDDVAGVDERDAWTIAATHSMSKRTMVYAGFNNKELTSDHDEDTFGAGIKHKF